MFTASHALFSTWLQLKMGSKGKKMLENGAKGMGRPTQLLPQAMALFRGCSVSECLPHGKCGVLWNADPQLSYKDYLWMVGFNACNMVNVNQKLATVPCIAKSGFVLYWHASCAVMTDRAHHKVVKVKRVTSSTKQRKHKHTVRLLIACAIKFIITCSDLNKTC